MLDIKTSHTMYPEEWVRPAREELTSSGIEEMRTSEEVDTELQNHTGSTLVVINSICGCAGGIARPGIKSALKHDVLPGKLKTVFAGQDAEATERARSYITEYPPSSPSVALFKDGKVVYMLERRQIEGRTPQHVADALTEAFDTYCK